MKKTHNLKQQIFNKFILFLRDSRGQISIMFALLLIPLIGFIGGALDFSQKISYENKLQATLDSVSIAVAKEIARDNKAKDADLKKIGDIIFKTNHLLPDNITASPYVILRDKETLTVSQTAILKTSFMSLVGVSKLNIEIATKVNIKRSDVELAMILDMSGSMRGSKMSDLKTATKDLVNTLIQDTTGLASVKISYIPWTRGVLINHPMNKLVLKNNNWGRYNCGGSRREATEKSAAKQPIPVSVDRWGDEEDCPQTSIVPLTDNKTKLLNAVNGWVAYGGTYSDTGLTWGWGTLSPAWNGLWSTTAKAKPYEKVKKFVVLMTDGDNNTTQADSRSRVLCKKMKAKGIKIYSIAFKAGKKAKKLLKKCASTSTMYIDASSGDALKEAFKQIADEVGAFYISG
ncbi:MAG: VWA domain-containing protein [Alphaproteobacteria bacterium]|nr:VWA domain-containing protein [Alphaproteobacteria bacterium]